MSVFLVILLPLLGSAVGSVLPTHARNAASMLTAGVALVGLVQMALLFPQVREGGVVREKVAWLPSVGIDLAARVDGFAWVFAMLVLAIGLLVVLYSRYYLSSADPMPRFYASFLGFMGAMLGIVLSGNLIQIVFFWELTSLCSFLLIGYWQHRADARRGARMAFLVTGAGGLCLLCGVLILGRIVGSYDLDAVLDAGAVVRGDALYPVALVLVLLGALTKSAQFPFHFWLPHAMAAPTPVSAYLHSATMVKAGVFLMARLWPVLSGTEAWFWIVGGTGLCTLLLGAYAAMFQTDLKALLAYSTISHLGLITLLLGLNSPLAAVAAVFHIMNHATFKASLFMAAGIIDHETGTRDIRRLKGLFKAMPITATLALVASAAMAGVPLLNGFLSKEMFFAETVYIESLPWVELGLPLAATLASIFAVVYSLRFSVDIFFGPLSVSLPRRPHDPVFWMRLPVEFLVLACLVVGIVPAWSIGPVLEAAARSVVAGSLPPYSLAVWHGFNLPLVMSILALAGGTVLYTLLRRQIASGRFTRVPMMPLDGRRMFEAALVGLTQLARRLTRVLGTRRLQPQLFSLILASAIAAALSLRGADALSWGDRPRVPATPAFVLLWFVGGACALGTAALAKFHRLAALTLMSLAGLVTCLTFVWFSAPDLALTQLVVEVVTTVLFLLGLRWLPKRVPQTDDLRRPGTLRRARDAAIALLAGSGLAALAFALLTRPAPQSISPFFLEKALDEGGGRNVVNVMLVDFRAFDTLGEIAVLAIVGLTVYAVLRRFRPARESIALPRQQELLQRPLPESAGQPDGGTGDRLANSLLVPAMLSRLVLPIALVVAVHLLMRGHNEPGGGFVAGLVVAVALINQYMVTGITWTEARIRPYPARWIATGLLLAVSTGVGSLFFGYPFLTTHTAHLHLPVLGDIHVPSAAVFDLGVFMTVVGATLLILVAIAHQSLRSPRGPAPGEVAHVAREGER
jgi:multicomponent K+:H+ antiporter subunit A